MDEDKLLLFEEYNNPGLYQRQGPFWAWDVFLVLSETSRLFSLYRRNPLIILPRHPSSFLPRPCVIEPLCVFLSSFQPLLAHFQPWALCFRSWSCSTVVSSSSLVFAFFCWNPYLCPPSLTTPLDPSESPSPPTEVLSRPAVCSPSTSGFSPDKALIMLNKYLLS